MAALVYRTCYYYGYCRVAISCPCEDLYISKTAENDRKCPWWTTKCTPQHRRFSWTLWWSCIDEKRGREKSCILTDVVDLASKVGLVVLLHPQPDCLWLSGWSKINGVIHGAIHQRSKSNNQHKAQQAKTNIRPPVDATITPLSLNWQLNPPPSTISDIVNQVVEWLTIIDELPSSRHICSIGEYMAIEFVGHLFPAQILLFYYNTELPSSCHICSIGELPIPHWNGEGGCWKPNSTFHWECWCWDHPAIQNGCWPLIVMLNSLRIWMGANQLHCEWVLTTHPFNWEGV